MEDLLEFTEKLIEIAGNDEQIVKKAKKTKTSLTIALKNGEDISFSMVIDSGIITFSKEEISDAEYKIEMSKNDYKDFLDGKIVGMKMLKAITIVKGSLMGMRKLSPIFESLSKIALELKGSQVEMVA